MLGFHFARGPINLSARGIFYPEDNIYHMLSIIAISYDFVELLPTAFLELGSP